MQNKWRFQNCQANRSIAQNKWSREMSVWGIASGISDAQMLKISKLCIKRFSSCVENKADFLPVLVWHFVLVSHMSLKYFIYTCSTVIVCVLSVGLPCQVNTNTKSWKWILLLFQKIRIFHRVIKMSQALRCQSLWMK